MVGPKLSQRTPLKLGNALAAQGKLQEAIAAYRTAIRLKPDFALAHNSLAWALVIPAHRPKDDYEEGLQHARKAVELSPKVPTASTRWR